MDNKPLITVAVPTYNRPESIKQLAFKFLGQISNNQHVDVVVLDNSSEDISKTNKETLSNFKIRYIKNDVNLGFHGNLVKCFERAQGKWLWIISDDDEVLLDNFLEAINWLKQLSINDQVAIKGVVLPYFLDKFGRTEISNTANEWNVLKNTSIKEMIKSINHIPFILFSSVIVNIEKISIDKIKSIYIKERPNDYMQFYLFCEAIGMDGSITFWHGSPLQIYKHAKEGRFPLAELIRSMDGVIKYVEDAGIISKRSIRKLRNSMDTTWMKWLCRQKSGLVVIQEADVAKDQIIRRILRNMTFIKLTYLMLYIFLPSSVLRFIFSKIL